MFGVVEILIINYGKDYLMKKSTLAVSALLASLSAAIIAPAVYAEDAAPAPSAAPTTATQAPACDPKDPSCKPDAATTTEGSTPAPAPSADAAPATGSDS